MELLINKPRDRFVAEVRGGAANLGRAERFIDDIIDDVQPSRITTGFTQGELYIVRKALSLDIPHRAFIPSYCHTVGLKDYREYCDMFRKSEVTVTSEGFNNPSVFDYRANMRTMLDNCDVLAAVWHKGWSSTKTIMEMFVAANKPVICYIVQSRERLFIYNNQEEIYTKEKLWSALNE